MHLKMLSKKYIFILTIFTIIVFFIVLSTVLSQNLSSASFSNENTITSTDLTYSNEPLNKQPTLVEHSPSSTTQSDRPDIAKSNLSSSSAAQSKEYDSELYEKKVNRIKTDSFGNQYVDLSMKNTTLKRYLVSNWHLYHPTPQEKEEGSVEGCMWLNYYVSYEAAVSLIVEEKGDLRLYHSLCQYDEKHHQYALEKQERASPDLADSIRLIIDNLEASSLESF